jgi:xanthine dehydrogenase small subunit
MPVEPPVASPRTLAEAHDLLAGDGDGPWRPLAGGTDLLVEIGAGLAPPPGRILDLWALRELRGIARAGDELVVGALTTWTELRRSELVGERLPVLSEMAATIGALQIQNRGTLGGNIANASPAGDSLPVLLAADAVIVLGGPRGEREVPAAAFFTGYRRTACAADELVVRVRFPLPAGREVRFRKVGTRRAQAISKVVMALAWRPDATGAWHDVRVALGSIAERPVRAPAAEAALEGRHPTPETAAAAAAAAGAEIAPIDDVRSTAEYRRAVTARVLHRLVRDAGGW